MNKRMTVTSGPKGNQVTSQVELNGVGANEQLTPKMAARAARIAVGGRSQVTVTSTNGHGYRLYANSARKFQVEE